jgi:predicted acetyltransferase
MTSDLTLVEPTAALQLAFLEMAAEFAAAGDLRYQPALADFAGYLQRLDHFAQGDNLPADHVRTTTYWGVTGSLIVGSIRLRHELTPALRHFGGHIGYDIRPTRRGRGYGTALLALTLERARRFGLAGVLLTSDSDNIGSIRVIEKNGGQLLDQGRIDGYDKMIRRYWIDFSPPGE